MKKLILLLLIGVFFISCNSREIESAPRTVDVCNCEEKEKLQQFINAQIIKASNNMSDEEMEDVIRELKYTGIDIYCKKKTLYFYVIDHEGVLDESKVKLDSCETIMNNY